VPPNLSPESLAIARDVVRRGLDDASMNAYRTGQNAAWRRWMATAFELTSDPEELREMLEVSARSIFTFVDETLTAIAEQIERERDQLTRGTHAERLEVVNLILEGAPSHQRARRGALGLRAGALAHRGGAVERRRAAGPGSARGRRGRPWPAPPAPAGRSRSSPARRPCGRGSARTMRPTSARSGPSRRAAASARRSARPPPASTGSAAATSTRWPPSA
jgi:hypothetical protein